MKRGFASLFFNTARNLVRLQRALTRTPVRGAAAKSTSKAKSKTQAKAGQPNARQRTSKPPAARPHAPTRPAAPPPRATALRDPRHPQALRDTRHPPEDPGMPGAGLWQPRQHFATPSGRRLAYARYLPPQPVQGLPVLVMLHGCRQDADEFARGTRMNLQADRAGFVVLYPQQALARQAQRCWRWFQPHTGGPEDADAIAALIRAETARHGLDDRRVYVAGLSAGAGMAALLALRHPALVCAVALHSGVAAGGARNAMDGLGTMRRGTLRSPAALVDAVADPSVYLTGMPAIILHGLRDTVVAARNARQLTEQFLHVNRLAGGDMAVRVLGQGTRREYRRTDVLRGRTPVVRLCEMPRLEHAWSGGDPAVPFHSSAGPDAAALIWQFFKRQRRR